MGKFLEEKKIYLKGLTKEDCGEQYMAFVNDVEALSFIQGIGYKPVAKEDLESYITSCNNPQNLLLGIFENKTNTHVGNIHLGQIAPYHNNCIYGIVLNKKYAGKGYAYEASRLVIKHAFEIMNIHRIQINCVEGNDRAKSLYKRLGAVEEGKMREAFRLNNKYHDVIIYSLLSQEYFKNKEK